MFPAEKITVCSGFLRSEQNMVGFCFASPAAVSARNDFNFQVIFFECTVFSIVLKFPQRSYSPRGGPCAREGHAGRLGTMSAHDMKVKVSTRSKSMLNAFIVQILNHLQKNPPNGMMMMMMIVLIMINLVQ